MSPAIKVPCNVRKVFTFQTNARELTDVWLPTCRSLADGKLGVFSRSSAPESMQADCLTLAVLNIESDSPNDVLVEAKRGISRQVDGQVSVARNGDWNLYGTGTHGRAVVWMEDDGSAPSGDTIPNQSYKMCFASFAAAVAPLQPDPAAPSTPLSTTAVVDEDHTVDTIDPSSSHTHTAGSTGTSSNSHESQDSDSVEDLENGEEELVWNPLFEAPEALDLERPLSKFRTSGHVCELELSADLARKYGGFNTVDFDDVRGRIAFATGSGQILICELVRG